jgi:hypothetical protein
MDQEARDARTAKYMLIQSVGIWAFVLIVGLYILLKPDHQISKDTVDKLTYAVDGLGKSAQAMTEVANNQRQWYAELQKDSRDNGIKRDDNYDGLYAKYDYSKDSTTVNLSDIYDSKLHQQAQAIGSKHLRGVEDSANKAGPVQESVSQPKK